jgi:glycosyltransferase involved in cell wall biosynthesis
MSQFVEPLATHDVELDIRPFLDSERFAKLYSNGRVRGFASLAKPMADRVLDTLKVRKYDLLFVQREAMIVGPAIFERVYQAVGRIPMVLDLDDATYVPYVSPKFGRLGSMFKFFGKTDVLIQRSAAVTCGNRLIAEYVNSKGARAMVVPTVVDTSIFRPIEKSNPVPVVGWIGTHSTFPFLERLFPVFSKLAEKNEFVLKIVGAGAVNISLPGVKIENLEWEREREIADFQSLDIGLYPVFPSLSASTEWLKGKSGFKAIQYMAAGVPFVMSPVGICAEIGEAERTHFLADGPDNWYAPLEKLVRSCELRESMGTAGRKHSIEHFSIDEVADTLAALFDDLA